MSVLNQSGEEQVECPLCMEPLEVDDLHFYPCTCGYQICRFCWNRIREGENGLCPACRKAYPENPADFTPLSQEQVAAIKTEKKAREQKRRNKTLESRRALANVRVVQNNLVFVVGLPVRLADPEILKRQEYFGKYGKIHKVVINQSPAYAGSQSPSASAYVTYVSPADALRAIQGVNNVTLDGRVLKGSLGTTKYCANFMKNQPCPKPDCMYLHELGDPKASFTKEEMHAGLHQVYERRLHQQLLAAKPDDKQLGNSSTNADKGSTKDGNQSNFIPTTVVTSSQINSVSTSKSKKDTNGSNVGNGSNGSNGNSGNGKEAWPSLGSSPPSDSPARKQLSPKPQQSTAKSQENGTSESSSPTLHNQQSQIKNGKDNNQTEKSNRSNKDSNSNTNGQAKKSKSDKSKTKNSISNESSESSSATEKTDTETHTSVFENDTQFLTNELDELESDRHSLLENHDLLDNSDHSLLEDDTHNLLNDANNEVLMMQRHREMLAGLVDNGMHSKAPLMNGYGLLDRDTMGYLANDRQISQISQGLMDQKELLMRERNRSMLLRQNELLARQHNVMVDLKHYMPSSSIGMESASELLGANYHPNPNMLPPFGMRVDNSLVTNSLGNTANTLANSLSMNLSNTLSVNSLGGNSMSANALGANSLGVNTLGVNSLGGNTLGTSSLGANTLGANSLGANTLGASSLGANTMGANSLGASTLGANSMGANTLGTNSMGVNTLAANSMGANTLGVNSMGTNAMGNTIGGFMLHNQQMQMQNQQHMQQSGLVNGFDSPQSVSEGRYQADTMDKFFTDFHKAQQMRLVAGGAGSGAERPRYPHNMLSAERLEMEHKSRMSNYRASDNSGGRAAGDGDDDLDFDPFKETQKALAEMMETEMMLSNISSGDNMDRVRRTRLPPPGFSHLSVYGRQQPQQQGFTNSNAMFSDWTQMDPAIMSTSVNFGKAQGALSQHELFARFNQLAVQPNGVKLHSHTHAHAHAHQQPAPWPAAQKPWGVAYNMPLPPGFAPPKTSQHPAECIDAK
ncbi:uncharacterized protein LOC123703560 isoform X3 [Colias croceus]|uniref:uncharacterized protein LOC123703560 isoform X3 n=1 Tax=Colias crocea TaxID=72248 RepID=UPI001E2814BB|nr:uncharacterized protein LOC123703560 isoform X3 [Colias croceus]